MSRPRLSPFLLLAALAVANGLLLALLLFHPRPEWWYPFPGPDSDDWIANGLALAGASVRYSVRPPLYPLLLALLHRCGALGLFPALNQAFLVLGVLILYRLLARSFSHRVSLVVSLAFLASASLGLTTTYAGADLAASVLLFAGAAAFLAAGERPGLYPLAGLLAGLSAVTQQAALLSPLPAAVALLAYRRSDLRRPGPWLGAAAFALPPALWEVTKRLAFGSFGDVINRNWSLLRPHLDGIGFYALAGLGLLGWPAALVAAAGAARALPRLRRDEAAGFLLALAAALLAFFVLCYDFEAKRLLLYACWPAGFFLARGLAGLERRRGFWLAAVAVLVGSALPAPGTTQWGEPRFLLWPAPPVYASLEGAGEGAAGLRSVAVHRAPWWRPAAATAQARALAARGAQAPPAPDPAPFATARSVVYLFPPGVSWEQRHQDQLRLGNALRRRVKFVPEELYPSAWWGFRGAAPLTDAGPFTALRLPLPAAPEWSALIVRRASPLAKTLRRGAAQAAPEQLAPTPADLARDLDRAAAVGRAVRGRDGFLIVLAEPAEWVRLLPFVAATSGLYVPPAAERASWLADLAAGPWEERFPLAGLPAGRRLFDGRRVLVVLPAADTIARCATATRWSSSTATSTATSASARSSTWPAAIAWSFPPGSRRSCGPISK
jgi:Dolichyl-phosphate-mannose-protein mannosyltransferase